MLAHALHYLKSGWSVIPLRPQDKKPAIEWAEFQERRATEDEVRSWWSTWPDANVGVVTGILSGIIVLDADGDEADATLNGKEMPPTPQSTTGKGHHHWFRHPGGVKIKNATRFMPGLDLRCDGGYVVAPPSIHPNGSSYCWTIAPGDSKPEDPPAWLKAELKETDPPPKGLVDLSDEDLSGDDWYEKLLVGVGEGERNSATVRLCGRWLGKGLSRKEVWNLLVSWNQRNTPPIDEFELRRTFESIVKIDTDKRAAKDLSDGKIPTVIDKELLLQAISTAFEIHVKKLIRIRCQPARFIMITDRTEIYLGGIEALATQNKMRLAILGSDDKRQLKTFQAKTWANLVQMMVNACEDKDVGFEGTDRGVLVTWLEQYLIDQRPVDEEQFEGSRPFYKDRELYIFSDSFRRYLRGRFNELITPKDLATRLKMLGGDGRNVWIGGSSRRVWLVPKDVVIPSKEPPNEKAGL